MGRMNIGLTNRRWLTTVTLACTFTSVALTGQRLGAQEPSGERPSITWSEASEHVGEEVTIEGRIVATHASPLSTLLSFDQSFNKFTAVIQPADRDAFPPKPEEYYRGKQVRITGRVVEYEKKAEIVLRNQRQIQIVEPEPTSAAATQKGEDTTQLNLEILGRLTAIETSLESIANRLDLILAALERQAQPQPPAVQIMPGRVPSAELPPRPRYQALRSLKRGMRGSQVERLVGTPIYVDPTTEGGETWYYGGGRSVTFNDRGRVEAMAGFQNR